MNKNSGNMRNIIFIILMFFLLFGVPVIINCAYNIGGYRTNWEAKDALSFYGAVLGGTATLIAVVMTINYENRVRRLENLRQKNNEKLQEIKARYSNALLLLDSTHIASMHISYDNSEPALNHLNHLSLEIRRTMTLEVSLDFEQNSILKDATAKIKDYAAEYSDLIIKLIETYNSLNTNKLYDTYNNLLNLLKSDYEKNVIEIDRIEKEISQLTYTKRSDFETLACNARMKIVTLSNEKYPDVYDSVISSIGVLEQHYESELEWL